MTDSVAKIHADRSQPENLRGRELSLSLTVADVAKSTAWYRDVLGFHVDRKMEREGKHVGTVMKAGVVRILLNQDDWKKGKDRKKGEGMSFQITTAQNIDDIAARARKAGAQLATEPADMPWGVRSFRIVDPDGFKIAISSERPA